MGVSKLETQKVEILNKAFWDKFGDHNEPPEADTSTVQHLCHVYMDNEEWLRSRRDGTGGVRALAKAVVCWMLEMELIKYNEHTWIGNKPWRVTTAELRNWWVVEPRVETLFDPIIDGLCKEIRESRAELKQWIKENRK